MEIHFGEGGTEITQKSREPMRFLGNSFQASQRTEKGTSESIGFPPFGRDKAKI
jgi:hypothetical protein